MVNLIDVQTTTIGLDEGIQHTFLLDDGSYIRVECNEYCNVIHVQIENPSRNKIKEVKGFLYGPVKKFLEVKYEYDESYILTENERLVKLLSNNEAEKVGEHGHRTLWKIEYAPSRNISNFNRLSSSGGSPELCCGRKAEEGCQPSCGDSKATG